MERKEDMQGKSSQTVYKLIANENKDLKEKLDWANKQIENMLYRTYKLEEYIDELNEKIIRLIKEG